MGAAAGPDIIEDGLVLCLDAANPKSYSGSGTNWEDLSGNGNNGTLVNGVVYSSSDNGSFSFDGVNDYIEVSNSSSLNPSNNTIICWAKSDNSTWNDNGYLMSKRNVFIIHPIGGQTRVGYYFFLNGSYISASVYPSNIQNWNMYAYSWDGTYLNAYLNGNLISSGAKTGPLNTSDTGVLQIGKDDSLSRYLDGNISICKIYNRALTASEIKQNYIALKGRFNI